MLCPYSPLQIEKMGVDIQSEGPRPRGEERQKALQVRHLPGQGKMEQHGSGCCCKGRCCLELGRAFLCCGQDGVQFLQGKACLLNAPEREIGVGVDQAGGELGPHVGAGEVRFCFPGRQL